jgi:predicted nucleotidyltransferase
VADRDAEDRAVSQFGYADCPAAVRVQVDELVGDLRGLIGDEELTGVYLHGSLAAGCFNPARSDLDVLAVTRGPVSLETKVALARRLLELSRRPAPIEISLVWEAGIHPWRYPTPYEFHYSEDWRATYERELEDGSWREWNAGELVDADLAAHFTILRARGLCLYGAPIRQVFPEVPARDYLDSVMGDVLSAECGLDALQGHATYAILNACRTLAYLTEGKVLSKDEGGGWGLARLPERYRPALAAVVRAYREDADDGQVEAEQIRELAAYLRGELQRAQQRH